MADSPSPANRCVRYSPGHSIHWIQARLTWSEPRPRTPVSILDIDDTGFSARTPDGVLRFLNHDTQQIREYVGDVGPEGELVGYGVLQLPTTGRGTIPMICVKLDGGEPLESCVRADEVPSIPRGALSDQIVDHLIRASDSFGGITISLD